METPSPRPIKTIYLGSPSPAGDHPLFTFDQLVRNIKEMMLEVQRRLRPQVTWEIDRQEKECTITLTWWGATEQLQLEVYIMKHAVLFKLHDMAETGWSLAEWLAKPRDFEDVTGLHGIDIYSQNMAPAYLTGFTTDPPCFSGTTESSKGSLIGSLVGMTNLCLSLLY